MGDQWGKSLKSICHYEILSKCYSIRQDPTIKLQSIYLQILLQNFFSSFIYWLYDWIRDWIGKDLVCKIKSWTASEREPGSLVFLCDFVVVCGLTVNNCSLGNGCARCVQPCGLPRLAATTFRWPILRMSPCRRHHLCNTGLPGKWNLPVATWYFAQRWEWTSNSSNTGSGTHALH